MQKQLLELLFCLTGVREVLETLATSKLKFFVIFLNGLQPPKNIPKNSIFDVVGVLDTPLIEALSI